MSRTAEDWGRVAVALPGWRWMPGMLSRCSTDTRRAVYRWLVGLHTRHYGLVCIVQDKHGRPCRNVATLQPGPDDLPDLTDPATLGCLESLVAETHNGAVVLMRGNGWFSVETEETLWDDDNAPSYVVALVAALEAAP